jgi:hypothetical protein
MARDPSGHALHSSDGSFPGDTDLQCLLRSLGLCDSMLSAPQDAGGSLYHI